MSVRTITAAYMVLDSGVTVRGAKFSRLGGELGPKASNVYTQGFVLYQTRVA